MSPRSSSEAVKSIDELQEESKTAASAVPAKGNRDLEAEALNAEDSTTLDSSEGVIRPFVRKEGEDEDRRSEAPAIKMGDEEHGGERELEEMQGHHEMESSTATLKPSSDIKSNTTSPNLSNDADYLDPTPGTPAPSQPPSRSTSNTTSKPHNAHSGEPPASPAKSDAGFDERISSSEDDRDFSSQPRSELQTIMEQFSNAGQAPGEEEVMSPRLIGFGGPLLGSPVQHPPRKSSLEPLRPSISNTTQNMQDLRIASDLSLDKGQSQSGMGASNPSKPDSIHSFPSPRPQEGGQSSTTLPISPPSIFRPPPPGPEPEPDLPFDFHRFLEQLRHRTADPVAKFLRSFLQEFGKKQWMVHEQVKIISDFLTFITTKMGQCEVWRGVSDAEFDNAREGMEKLVMNRLYTQTFSPAIPPPQSIPGSKPKRKGGERPMGSGRRGQHQEDIERDDVLAQKIGIYGWVKENHLDIPPVSESGRRFLVLAKQELLKIKTYRAPRDKIICVLNCCKVIFGLLMHSKTDSSADSFMPLLIYVVLQANPEHLVSNVQYILRFRNQDKLGGEAGYYLSSLMGAVQFIENLDRTTLTISEEEFEQRVEAAVSAIAEKHRTEITHSNPLTQLSEKSTISRPEVTPRHSMEGESSIPRRSTSSNEDNADVSDEKAAMSGLLRTIQKPLSSIGRIFSDDPTSTPNGPAWTPPTGSTPRMTPSPRPPNTGSPQIPQKPHEGSTRERMTAEDAAARQASAEAAEAQRIQRAEHSNVVETLAGMFPDLDREIISDVVRQKEGRVGLAVDACLALSS